MQCCICLLEPTLPTQAHCCGNWFCTPCVNEWYEIKNTCPLCGAQKGPTKINKLGQHPREQSFDNGFMMLETQINQINQRVTDVSERVFNRSASSQDYRSTFSRSHILFLEDQIALVKMYQTNMNEKWFIQDRVNAVEAMQVVTEVLITIEAALNDRSIGYEYDPHDEYDNEDQYWDEYEDDYDDYEEYEVLGKKKLNAKGGRKSKGSLLQQEQQEKKTNSKGLIVQNQVQQVKKTSLKSIKP